MTFLSFVDVRPLGYAVQAYDQSGTFVGYWDGRNFQSLLNVPRHVTPLARPHPTGTPGNALQVLAIPAVWDAGEHQLMVAVYVLDATGLPAAMIAVMPYHINMEPVSAMAPISP